MRDLSPPPPRHPDPSEYCCIKWRYVSEHSKDVFRVWSSLNQHYVPRVGELVQFNKTNSSEVFKVIQVRTIYNLEDFSACHLIDVVEAEDGPYV